jgi:iron complex outermembrane receptor protein
MKSLPGIAAPLSIAIVLFATMSPSHAQSTPAAGSAGSSDSGTTLTEVIVTAERRESTIQKSSLAIEVVDSAELQRSGVTQATDLTGVVPGVQIGTNGALTQAYVRGVGDAAANPTATSPVAFNVDGVYIARQEGVGVNFYDLERVEVLKGPQGTLYGRNASGGAINLITRAPTLDSFGGYATLESGNYGLVHFETAVNAPLSNTFAVRAAFNIVRRDGYLSDGTDDERQVEGRIRALWKPNDDVSLLLNADAASLTGRGPGFVYGPRRPGSDPWEGVLAPAAQAYLATFNPVVPRTADVGQDNHYWNVSAELNADLGFATLTVLPAFRHMNYDDLNYLAFIIDQQSNSDQRSVEVRLASQNDFIKWVGGLYYFNEKLTANTTVDASDLIQHVGHQFLPTTKSYAAFGQATLSVTDALRLIAGARYTSDHLDIQGINTDLATPAAPATPWSGNGTFTKPTWKAGIEYDLAEHHMAYFTAATGFKSGGFNQEPAPNAYQPETLTAFDLGLRNRFLDNRLQANFELFYWKYHDQQSTVVSFDNTFNINLVTYNAGQATMKGANLDLTFKAGNRDTLHFATEYNDSKYSRFEYTTANTIFGFPIFNPAATGCPLGPATPGPLAGTTVRQVNCAGFPLPRAPKVSGSASWDHSMTLRSATVDLNAELQFATSRYLASNFTNALHANSYRLLNLNASYTPPSERWSIAAFVRNVTNAAVYTGGFDSAFSSPLAGLSINPPRTYGARASVKF